MVIEETSKPLVLFKKKRVNRLFVMNGWEIRSDSWGIYSFMDKITNCYHRSYDSFFPADYANKRIPVEENIHAGSQLTSNYALCRAKEKLYKSCCC
jgi:hypothetical protein